jgi:hypothetical protein
LRTDFGHIEAQEPGTDFVLSIGCRSSAPTTSGPDAEDRSGQHRDLGHAAPASACEA